MNKCRIIDREGKLIDVLVPDKNLSSTNISFEGCSFHATCGFGHSITVLKNGEPIGFVPFYGNK